MSFKFLILSYLISLNFMSLSIFAEDKDSPTSNTDSLNQIEYDTFGFRFKKGRISALKKYGGSEATEMAVIKALRWLKAHQGNDGSWCGNTGISGLALLAFLGHGESPSSERYGDCVKNSIEYMVKVSKQNNGYIDNRDSRPAYTHAIATFAIAEAYGLTRDPALRDVMNNAVKLIVQGQNRDGGFDYRYGDTSRSDISVGGWNMQAMNAARQVSCDVEGLDIAIIKAVKCVKSLYVSESSMFAYDRNSGSSRLSGIGKKSLTAVGTLCLSELEGDKSLEFNGSLKYLIKNAKFDWESNDQWQIYMWYYQTLSFFRSEVNWKEWNSQMISTLIKHQFDDGHWEEQSNFGLSGKEQLQVYSTALCVLMLEVYYRYYTGAEGDSVKRGNKTKAFEDNLEKIQNKEGKTGNKILLR